MKKKKQKLTREPEPAPQILPSNAREVRLRERARLRLHFSKALAIVGACWGGVAKSLEDLPRQVAMDVRTWLRAAHAKGLAYSQARRPQVAVVAEMARVLEWEHSLDALKLGALLQCFLVCWVCASKTAGGKNSQWGFGKGTGLVFDVARVVKERLNSSARFMEVFGIDMGLHKGFGWAQKLARESIGPVRPVDVYMQTGPFTAFLGEGRVSNGKKASAQV